MIVEPVPVAAGVIVGLLVWRLVPARVRIAVAIGVAFPIGAVISWLAGELELSWGFILVDVGQVVLAALLVIAVATAPAAVRGSPS